jgi:hypothetical protein
MTYWWWLVHWLWRIKPLRLNARLVYDLKPSDHVTPVLKDLHWLPIKERVDYQLCILMHNVSTGRAPLYMSDVLTACADVLSIDCVRRPAVTALFRGQGWSLVKERSPSPLPGSGKKPPYELKSTKVTSSFKRLLKTFLFTSACNTNWLTM